MSLYSTVARKCRIIEFNGLGNEAYIAELLWVSEIPWVFPWVWAWDEYGDLISSIGLWGFCGYF